jgi:type II secretory pathway pseudopilin PulG
MRVPGLSKRRRGITLLELVITSSMLAVIGTSLGLVLRTSRTAWETNDSATALQQHAHAVVQHFVRNAREAYKVIAITATAVTLETRAGEQLTWSHQASGPDGRTNVVMVRFSFSGSQYPLAYNIRNLTFAGYKADGVTATTVASDVKIIQVNATVEQTDSAQLLQTAASRVWIRAW